MVRVVAVVILIVLLVDFSSATSLGDGLWRTFNLALIGAAPSIPITTTEAISQKWQKLSDTCDPNLGYRYAYKSSGPTQSSPLTVYYTAAGQVSGLAVDIYGAGSAPQNLVNLGFWQPVSGKNNQWTMSVSFREASQMCNTTTVDEVLGDRLVINQGTIDYNLPLTAAEANCQGWTYGSCMLTMGEHWFYDVENSPYLSWQPENLLPIVVMYYPPTIDGVISTFFFTTPVEQPGANYLLHYPGDWETPALTPSNMCENFCNSTCAWPGVTKWSTMHIYVNSQWSYISCPNGEGIIKRYCPASFPYCTN